MTLFRQGRPSRSTSPRRNPSRTPIQVDAWGLLARTLDRKAMDCPLGNVEWSSHFDPDQRAASRVRQRRTECLRVFAWHPLALRTLRRRLLESEADLLVRPFPWGQAC